MRSFIGWNGKVQSLCFLYVTAHAREYDENGALKGSDIRATKLLDENGKGRIIFWLSITTYRLEVYKLTVKFEGTHYVVGTRVKQTDDLVTIIIGQPLNLNPWKLPTLLTGSSAAQFGTIASESIVVADDLQRIADWTRKEVIASIVGLKKIPVWYSGPGTGGYVANAAPNHISLPASASAHPDVIAHEFGHWVSFQARGFDTGSSDKAHGACNSVNVPSAWAKGYASVFGLMALDNTILTDSAHYGLVPFALGLQYILCLVFWPKKSLSVLPETTEATPRTRAHH